MPKQVSFARSTRNPIVAPATKPTRDSGVNGGEISPSKGGYISPRPACAPAQKNEKENPVTVESVLSLAQSLDPKARKQLLAELALAARPTALRGDDRELDMWAQAVYDGLVQAVGPEVGAGQGPMLYKRALGLPSAWEPVAEFMAASKLADLKVIERASVYGMLARLVIARARSLSDYTGAPLGPKFVANCTSSLAALFESAFPGYLANGLAPFVAKQLVKAR